MGVAWLAGSLLLASSGAGALPDAVSKAKATEPLAWDVMERVIEAQPGKTSAGFQFTATNVSAAAVTVHQIRPTCGCVVAEMPATPWVLAPSAGGTFIGTIEFAGTFDTFSKALLVDSSAGTQRLMVTVKLPVLDEAQRKRNRRIALADRQAVFRGECAPCHVPAEVGRSGERAFTLACGICHLGPRRLDSVPDLLVARQHRDAAFWRKWISEGGEGAMMPAWSQARGGPLTPEQIESLVEFCLTMLPSEPRRE